MQQDRAGDRPEDAAVVDHARHDPLHGVGAAAERPLIVEEQQPTRTRARVERGTDGLGVEHPYPLALGEARQLARALRREHPLEVGAQAVAHAQPVPGKARQRMFADDVELLAQAR